MPTEQDFAKRDTSSLVNVGGGGAPTPVSQVGVFHCSLWHARAGSRATTVMIMLSSRCRKLPRNSSVPLQVLISLHETVKCTLQRTLTANRLCMHLFTSARIWFDRNQWSCLHKLGAGLHRPPGQVRFYIGGPTPIWSFTAGITQRVLV